MGDGGPAVSTATILFLLTLCSQKGSDPQTKTSFVLPDRCPPRGEVSSVPEMAELMFRMLQPLLSLTEEL